MAKFINKIPFIILAVGIASAAPADSPGKDKIADPSVKSAQGSFWTDPVDIQTRDLFYGPGGKDHEPKGTNFTFVDEDTNGSNPKYNVKDADGTKWKAKLGAEAKPETAATRLLWAVGYNANEDYFLPEIHVAGLPSQLHRGNNQIGPDGDMHDVRLKRHLKGESKASQWSWKDNPFAQTREWNGLRVMMAVLSNWDVKDENNSIYEQDGQKIYMVSDLGASFGTTGFNPSQTTAKGNLNNYRNSHFITGKSKDSVDFGVPSRPAMIVVFNPAEFIPRMNMRWIGKHIPREDCRWMGQMLAKLSPAQIRDAFKAAGYDGAETEGFAQIVEHRIAELNAL